MFGLYPEPRHLSLTEEKLPASIDLQWDPLPDAWNSVLPALKLFKHAFENRAGPGDKTPIRVRWTTDHRHPNEGYRLFIGSAQIEISAAEPAGAFYALQTLRQLLFSGRPISGLKIEDSPSLDVRGYMLDVSRDRIPRMDFLKRKITELGHLKINQLQLYTEHVFAYPGHETVWGRSSPFTADEIIQIDTWCAESFIELVPCLNTLGHCERWLRHEAYFPLAECPHGWMRADGYGFPYGTTLRPGPESLQFITSLLDTYLPLFRSRRVNLGGDEPWELGMGHSREACDRYGKHSVYADWMASVAMAAQKHKDEVHIWSDVAVENPKVFKNRFKSIQWNVWGYESDHPFESQIEALQTTGEKIHLCPGTSAWNSLGTRLDNALENINRTIQVAEKFNLKGCLLTDWGDYGHHQPEILSLPPLVHFGILAWNAKAARPDLSKAFSVLFDLPEDNRFADHLHSIGQIDRYFNIPNPNKSVLAQGLLTDRMGLSRLLHLTTPTALEKSSQVLNQIHFDHAAKNPMEDQWQRQIQWTQRALSHVIARFKTMDGGSEKEHQLRVGEMSALIGEFETLWLESSRIGGLHESSSRLRNALASYRSFTGEDRTWPPPSPS